MFVTLVQSRPGSVGKQGSGMYNTKLMFIAANIVTISVFDVLSIGSGPVAAVLLCVIREAILEARQLH